jgi:hypothetical protein
MQINLNTPSTAATSTAQTVAPAVQTKTTTTNAPSTADTVTLSAEAKAKFAAETIGSEPLMTTLGNGSGNEPPMSGDKDEDKEK